MIVMSLQTLCGSPLKSYDQSPHRQQLGCRRSRPARERTSMPQCCKESLVPCNAAHVAAHSMLISTCNPADNLTQAFPPAFPDETAEQQSLRQEACKKCWTAISQLVEGSIRDVFLQTVGIEQYYQSVPAGVADCLGADKSHDILGFAQVCGSGAPDPRWQQLIHSKAAYHPYCIDFCRRCQLSRPCTDLSHPC